MFCSYSSSSIREKQNAVQDYRTLIGATDPKNAAEGTLRKEFAIDGRQNSLHGSDSIENAAREIAYFLRILKFSKNSVLFMR